MFKNLLLSSIRNLKRNGFNSIISLLSLIVGITAFICIIKFNIYEFDFDSFHEKSKNIYRLTNNFTNTSGSYKRAMTFHALHPAVQEISGVANSTLICPVSTDASTKVKDQIFSEGNLAFTSPSFFEMFSFNLIKGSSDRLEDPNSIFLSQTIAHKYFGEKDPLGEEIEMRNIQGVDYKAYVAGVYEDMPDNSHIKVDALLPISWLNKATDDGLIFGPGIDLNAVTWRWTNFYSYVEIRDGARTEEVEKNMQKFVDSHRSELNKSLNQTHDLFLQPLSKIHTTADIQYELRPTVNAQLLHIFLIVAILILLVSWFNYTNLTIAQAMERTKEVGIRKVLGSSRLTLVKQFSLESVTLNVLALIMSYLLILLLGSQIESILEKPIFDDFWVNASFHIKILAVVLTGAILAGLYPSLGLTSYRPMDAIQGKLKHSSKGVFIRKILISAQFIFATFFISALLIIQSQFYFLIDHDLGININNVISLKSPGASQSNNTRGKIDTFLDRLEASPSITKAALSSVVPGIQNNWRHSASIIGTTSNEGVIINRGVIDPAFLGLYNLKLLSGRMFSDENKGDKLVAILNEQAVSELGFEIDKIIGERIAFPGNQEFEVIGVIANFYQKGLQSLPESFSLQLDTANAGAYISIKYEAGNANEAMAEIEEVFKSTFPDEVFSLSFVDEIFRSQYSSDKKFRNVIVIFTSIIILLSCLGILGLSAFVANQKIKEISIRKILGAKLSTLFFLLNREYLILVFISFCISCPLVVYVMHQWLNNYANKISIEIWMLILPLAFILVLILGITIRNTLKVLLVNPARILRED